MKKREAIEDALDEDTIGEAIPEVTNDVRTCTGTGVINFGEEMSSNRDEGRERELNKEYFINETRLSGKNEFDNAIKL